MCSARKQRKQNDWALMAAEANTIMPHLDNCHCRKFCLAHVLQHGKARHPRRMGKVVDVRQLNPRPLQHSLHGGSVC
jgi:hypothetical protein